MSEAPTLSFGIEIECILLFHESLLQQHLGALDKIKKELTSDEEVRLRSRTYPNVPYKSWGLESIDETGHHGTSNLKKYGTQVLQIANGLFDQAKSCPEITICRDKSQATYDTWQIMRDNSLQALDKESRHAILESRSIPEGGLISWDSAGIELVSPVYALSSEGLTKAGNEIGALVTMLDGRCSAGATNKSCGLHVHIGLPDGSRMPLDVLQHLAFITLIYESHISLLHPEHRSGVFGGEISSNRLMSFVAEPYSQDPRDRRTVVLENAKSRREETTIVAVEAIRRAIFSAQSIQELVELLGASKFQIINWSRLLEKEGEQGNVAPATIEFRQHDGCLEAKDIRRWVSFCGSLVRLAYRCAEEQSSFEKLSRFMSWDDRLDLKDLLDALDLEDNLKLIWMERYLEALDQGRDPQEGLWEEVFDDEDESEKSGNDSGVDM